MKKWMAVLISLSLLICCFSLSSCSTTGEVEVSAILEEIENNSYAVIVDKDGDVIRNLEISVSIEEISNSQKNTGTTYTITCIAKEGAADTENGITVAVTITWNDIKGTTNLLATVSGAWTDGNETITSRSVEYGAMDIEKTSVAAFDKIPTGSDFSYSPSNCTGSFFYLRTSATIDANGNSIILYVQTA